MRYIKLLCLFLVFASPIANAGSGAVRMGKIQITGSNNPDYYTVYVDMSIAYSTLTSFGSFITLRYSPPVISGTQVPRAEYMTIDLKDSVTGRSGYCTVQPGQPAWAIFKYLFDNMSDIQSYTFKVYYSGCMDLESIEKSTKNSHPFN